MLINVFITTGCSDTPVRAIKRRKSSSENTKPGRREKVASGLRPEKPDHFNVMGMVALFAGRRPSSKLTGNLRLRTRFSSAHFSEAV